ncbi:MAG TPA: c-type cytochrome [Bryobacteraceae bacterium]|nr:c-type cytochrome [Bryobacteraceae bacterium]
MRTLTVLFVLVCVSAASGMAADAKAGQALYNKVCKSCHGADGTPNAAIAKMTKADMKDLKSPEVQSMSDDDLKAIIISGKGKMKPVRVTSAEADNLVAYIRSLKK